MTRGNKVNHDAGTYSVRAMHVLGSSDEAGRADFTPPLQEIQTELAPSMRWTGRRGSI